MGLQRDAGGAAGSPMLPGGQNPVLSTVLAPGGSAVPGGYHESASTPTRAARSPRMCAATTDASFDE